MDKYRAEEPRYLWYCGTTKYRKGDGTGTVEKWYRGAAVVPYRGTAQHYTVAVPMLLNLPRRDAITRPSYLKCKPYHR